MVVLIGDPPGTPAVAAPELVLDGASDQLRRRLLERSRGAQRGDEPEPEPAPVQQTGPLSGVQALLALVDDQNDNERRKVVR